MFGIAQIVVNPPRAAARAAVATVSAASPPGSRRWAWRSHRPGASDEPAAIDPLGARIGLRRDEAIDDGHVPDLIGPGSRVDDTGADHAE